MAKTCRTLLCAVLAAMLLLGLTACGADGSHSSSPTSPDGGYLDEGLKEDVELSEGDTEQVTDERKIIETIDLSVQTKNFDALLDGLYSQIDALGGYVESSDISGNSFDYEGNRSAMLTVRIPAEQSDAFSEYVSQNSVVTRRNVTTEDVTLKYIDIESRLSALETERASLEALLAQATSVEEVITVRERLTQVIASIESYTAQLRTLQNLVSYTTVTLNIYEVEKTVVVEEQTVWERIAYEFGENLQSVGEWFVECFVFVVTSLPFLIPFAVLAAVIVGIALLVAWIHKRKKK